MDERLLNRVFNEAAASEQALQSAKRRKESKNSAEKGADDADLDTSAPMQASDAIKRILSAKKEKDWFRYCPSEEEPSRTTKQGHAAPTMRPIDCLHASIWG